MIALIHLPFTWSTIFSPDGRTSVGLVVCLHVAGKPNQNISLETTELLRTATFSKNRSQNTEKCAEVPNKGEKKPVYS